MLLAGSRCDGGIEREKSRAVGHTACRSERPDAKDEAGRRSARAASGGWPRRGQDSTFHVEDFGGSRTRGDTGARTTRPSRLCDDSNPRHTLNAGAGTLPQNRNGRGWAAECGRSRSSSATQATTPNRHGFPRQKCKHSHAQQREEKHGTTEHRSRHQASHASSCRPPRDGTERPRQPTGRQPSTDHARQRVRRRPADSHSTLSLSVPEHPTEPTLADPSRGRATHTHQQRVNPPGPSLTEGTHGPGSEAVTFSLSGNPMTAVPATPRWLGQCGSGQCRRARRRTKAPKRSSSPTRITLGLHLGGQRGRHLCDTPAALFGARMRAKCD